MAQLCTCFMLPSAKLRINVTWLGNQEYSEKAVTWYLAKKTAWIGHELNLLTSVQLVHYWLECCCVYDLDKSLLSNWHTTDANIGIITPGLCYTSSFYPRYSTIGYDCSMEKRKTDIPHSVILYNFYHDKLFRGHVDDIRSIFNY